MNAMQAMMMQSMNDPAMSANMMGMMQQFMGAQGGYMDPQGYQGGYGGGYGYQQQGPTMEEQIAAAKPMLKNIDQTTKKFIDTHCHIDTMYKKEQFQGDWDTYR